MKAYGMMQQSTEPPLLVLLLCDTWFAQLHTRLVTNRFLRFQRLKTVDRISAQKHQEKTDLSGLRASNQLSDLASRQSKNINNLEARKHQPASRSISSSA